MTYRPWRSRLGALVGPLLVGLAVIATSARGPEPPVLVVGGLAAVITLASLATIALRDPGRPYASALILPTLGLAWFLLTLRGAPLAAPSPYPGPWPAASPPAAMEVFAIQTGSTHRSAAFAYRGGSPLDARELVMTSVLVKHPRGDLLIDTGLGKDIATHLQTLPVWFRALTDYTRTRSVAEQLAAAGYDRANLHAIILTHAHWDHVSGLPELAGTPVWVTAEERRAIDDGDFTMATARSLAGVRYETYGFTSGPYLGFPASHDVYGDGAIVIVPAPGHTPGSVIVFLTVPRGLPHALLGDLVWQREGITLREERPWLQRRADADEAAVRTNILRVSALAARFPELVLAPAHDARGFTLLPRLPVR